jgi:hypothetical protein
MILSTAMTVLAVVALIGVFADSRVLVGAPIWLKVFKFSVSFVLYGTTLAWMLSLLPRRSRIAWWAATVIVVMAFLEMAVITTQVIRGHTSHFNETNAFDGMLWDAMGKSILVLWLAQLVVAVVLARQPLGDRAATYAVRLGLLVSLLGMLAAIPMVMPSAAPGIEGITGGHSVGLADGSGPTMPVTAWNLTGGDLRIGHFVGLHGLQALPLLALLLSVLARRPRLRLDQTTRVRLIVVGAVAYTLLMTMLTWQALRGQALLRPDAVSLAALAALIVVTVAAVGLTLSGRRPAGVTLVGRRSALAAVEADGTTSPMVESAAGR